MPRRHKRTRNIYAGSFCLRCGARLNRYTAYHGRGGRGYCRDCWPYVARGFFDLRLPEDWMGPGTGLLKLPSLRPPMPEAEEAEGGEGPAQ